MKAERAKAIKNMIRTIPDFPKPGILFRDVSTLFLDPAGLRHAIDLLVAAVREHAAGFDKIVAIEARGFVLGGALARELECGLVLARKRGKLPGKTAEVEYALEYGTDCVQIHADAIEPGDRCLIVDDLLATGGTCMAACRLVEKLGGRVSACAFVINLPDLPGARILEAASYPVHWLVEFEGH